MKEGKKEDTKGKEKKRKGKIKIGRNDLNRIGFLYDQLSMGLREGGKNEERERERKEGRKEGKKEDTRRIEEI